MIPKDKCTKEIVKIAENDAEVRYFIELKSGEKIYLDEYTKSYGSQRVLQEKQTLQAELAKWEDTKTIDAFKASAQAKLAELQEVETKLTTKEIISEIK